MLMPSIFGEDMFDEFMRDFPFFDERDERRAEKKLYGRRGKNLMKTDVKETDQGYELEMDLPGFTKDEVKVSLENGYLTIQAAKGLDQDEQEIDLKQNFDDDDDIGLNDGGAILEEDEVMTSMDGYTLEDDPDDNNMFDDSGFFDEDGDDLLDFDSIASDIREE